MERQEHFFITVVDNLRERSEEHTDLVLFYQISGSLEVYSRDRTCRLDREDIVLVNVLAPYEAKGNGITCRLAIDYRMVSALLPPEKLLFFANSVWDTTHSYEELREILRELLYHKLIETEEETVCLQYSLILRLLHCLQSHFHSHPLLPEDTSKGADRTEERMRQIAAYVYDHYQESISLTRLAEEMYLSTSTLSRLFYKQTGIYFAEYLTRVRLQYAAQELLYSEKPITRVAADCGFSNASAFAKDFRSHYGSSPKDYRRIERARQQERRSERERIEQELAERIELLHPVREKPDQAAGIEIDTAEGVPCGKPWGVAINIGALFSLIRANLQSHLKLLAEDMHFTHVRIWSVFSQELQITDGKTIGAYNYDLMDTILDAVVSMRLAVYFDFGRRPDTAVRKAGERIFYRDNAILFQSRRAWEGLFEDFILHILDRYGESEVGNWIFEFGEDGSFEGSGHYYESPDYAYEDVFLFAWRVIKEACPRARVGGPGCIPVENMESTEVFLRKCREAGVKPDFFSLILFPYLPIADGGFRQASSGEFEAERLDDIRALLSREGFPECPVYVAEWNCSVSNRNYLNDSCYRGTYLLSRAADIMKRADFCAVWMGSDWVSNYTDSRGIINGGGGLLTKDGIRKPAFFALSFLNRLGTHFLAAGGHYLVTGTDTGSFMILTWNHRSLGVSYYLEDEGKLLPEETDRVLEKGAPIRFELALRGLPEGAEYVIKTRSVSRNHGSVLDEWAGLHYERHLERADIHYLSEICVPRLQMGHERVSAGRLTVPVLLEEDEFQLLHIYRERRG